MLRSIDGVGQNMSSFIRGLCICTVGLCGILRQFNVVFSPQWISVCKIHACKVAYHAPFHPWVYLVIKNSLFTLFLIPLPYVWTLLQYPEL